MNARDQKMSTVTITPLVHCSRKPCVRLAFPSSTAGRRRRRRGRKLRRRPQPRGWLRRKHWRGLAPRPGPRSPGRWWPRQRRRGRHRRSFSSPSLGRYCSRRRGGDEKDWFSKSLCYGKPERKGRDEGGF